MDASENKSEIIVGSPNGSVNSNTFFESDIDKCVRLVTEYCKGIVKTLEHTALTIDDPDELEIWKMVDVAKRVREASHYADAFPSMMKEVHRDHCTNKGRNTNLITEEYVMYLHHYGEVLYI